MIKVYTSYFYQIRFFKPNMIPISTAVWDPKWFHPYNDRNGIFKDKNNVYNGIRSRLLHPGKECDGMCAGPENCIAKYGQAEPDKCDFLKTYREQLNKIDCNKLMQDLEDYAYKIKEKEGFEEEPVIVLIVYEVPSNPCSERVVLQEWFNKNGIECKELEYPIK